MIFMKINCIGQERKIFGVSLRKSGKRELVTENNDYNFEEYFYKMVHNESYTEGSVRSKERFFLMFLI